MLYLWLLSQGLTIGSFDRIDGVADVSATRSFIDSLPLLFADELKFLANILNEKNTETNTLTLKGVIKVDFEMGTLQIVKSHENFSLIVNGNLKRVHHVN